MEGRALTLHDDAAPTADRGSGRLLLLPHAQHINATRHLPVDHIRRDGAKLRILLGNRQIVLSAPLDALVGRVDRKPARSHARG